LDAGHGGRDAGAIGSFSKEKNINLAITLALGRLIEKNFDDVKVVYTRKTDVFLELQERADIVNKHHADLFICVHTNSSPSSSAYGSETYTLGLAKTKSNLNVAMRENSVILLEDNYKNKYQGFDPQSVDSYIMFEFMQDKYIDSSVDFASTVQKQFAGYARRSDRGVRQAGFWVLHRSACPSVLVEVGFISNAEEERFLNSDEGQEKIAGSIYNAFVAYKHKHDLQSGRRSSKNARALISEEYVAKPDSLPHKAPDEATDSETPQNTETGATNSSIKNNFPVFKVQLFASNVKLKANSSKFKGVTNANYFEEDGFFKYTIGEDSDYSKIQKTRKELLKNFPDAFIIAFVNGKKTPLKEALKMKNK